MLDISPLQPEPHENSVGTYVQLTETPVSKLGHQLHVTGDSQDVEVVEEDVHHQNNPQMLQRLGGDVPQLPFLAGQLGVVHLRKANMCVVKMI